MEPIVSVTRFNRAAVRLEVLRGASDASGRLFERMTRRFRAWNIRDEVDPELRGLNFRITDEGASVYAKFRAPQPPTLAALAEFPPPWLLGVPNVDDEIM